MYDSNTIVWEKWIDPFSMEEDLGDSLNDDEDPEFLDDEYSPDQEKSKAKDVAPSSFRHFKAVATPMGIIPINESTTSGKPT